MVTIHERRGAGKPFCDGVSRRDFLRVGGLAMGGLSLADLLAAEARAQGRPGSPPRSSHKAVIMVFLCGGPPHQDMFDLKPEAPAGIRGEFKPIETNVAGIRICEHLPRLAKRMDRVALIRSLVGARDEHTSHVCMSGYTLAETRQGSWPCLGSAVSSALGPVDPTVPPHVNLSVKMSFPMWAHPGEHGFLGLAHAPLQPHGPVAQDMALRGISPSRLQDRRRLLRVVDRLRRDGDTRLEGADAVTQRAFEILTSSRMVQAMDVSREDPKVRERYGPSSLQNVDDGGPMWNEGLLISRRLVEAGARVVTIGYGRWDYHGNNFGQCRQRLPLLDHGVSALVQDLHDRGLDRDVSVVVWGEFGRTPKINGDGGRDHWPAVSCALLAGGGMRTGQVIGSTTPDGGYADDRPVHYRDVMATLYHNLGLDVRKPLVSDSLDRPRYLLEGHEPLEELI